MDPRSLFKPGLTVPEHELKDLHYIGEALPVPSLITSSISVEADADVGGSPVPAREDHIHAVDVESLIQFINENEELVDLTNYYTKQEADAIHDAMSTGGVDLSNYYTKGEVDTFLNILATSVDDLDSRVTLLEAGGATAPLRAEWSWPGNINNETAIFPYWVAPRTGGFRWGWVGVKGVERIVVNIYKNDGIDYAFTAGVATGPFVFQYYPIVVDFVRGDRIHIQFNGLTNYNAWNFSCFLEEA